MDYEEFAKAFREEEVKTKHLKQKADKKKTVKKTRAIKRADADKLDVLRQDLTRKIEYSLSHIIQTNAKNCEAVSFLKGKMKMIRQTISEWFPLTRSLITKRAPSLQWGGGNFLNTKGLRRRPSPPGLNPWCSRVYKGDGLLPPY